MEPDKKIAEKSDQTKTQDHRNQPSFFSIALFHGFSGLKYLIVVLVVLFAFAALLELAGKLKAGVFISEVGFESLPEFTSNDEITIKGRLEPGTQAKLQVNGKQFSPIKIYDDEIFESWIPLARQVNEVVIEFGDTEHPKRESWQIQYIKAPLLNPEIRSILELPEDLKVLIGATDAGSTISLMRKNPQRTEVSDFQQPPVDRQRLSGEADGYGVFVLVLDDKTLSEAEDFVLKVSHPEIPDSVTLDLKTAIREADWKPVFRSLRLDISSDRPQLQLVLTAPGNFPHLTALLTGNMSSRSFIRNVFGDFPYNLEMQPAEWTVVTDPDGTVIVNLQIQGQKLWYIEEFSLWGGLIEWPLLTEKDSFTLVWGDARPQWFASTPAVLESRKAIWRGPLDQIKFGLPESLISEELPDHPDASKKDSQDIKAKAPTLRDRLSALNFPDIWHVFATSVLLLIPFAWFLYTLHMRQDFCASGATGPSDTRAGITAVVLILAVLTLRYPAERLLATCGVVFAQGTKIWDFWTAFDIMWLASLTTLPFVVKYLEQKSNDWNQGYHSKAGLPGGLRPIVFRSAVLLTLMVLVWLFGKTLMLQIITQLTGQSWSGRGAELFGLIPVFFLVLGVAGYGIFFSYAMIWLASLVVTIVSPAMFRQSDFLVPAFFIFGVFILVISLLPIRRQWHPKVLGKKPWRRYLAAALVLIGLASWEAGRLTSWIGAIFAVWAYIWICYFIYDTLRNAPEESNNLLKIGRSATYLLAVIFCFPSGIKVDFWRVGYLLNHFNLVGKYLLVIVILAWLYRQRQQNSEAELTLAPWLGPALFAFFLIGSAAYVFYVPIPLILGYFLARYFLFRVPDESPPAVDLEDGEQSVAIQELIRWRWLVRMRRIYQKMQDKKLQKGDINLAEHQTALVQFDSRATRLTGARQAHGTQRMRALTRGPYTSAWQNAVISVKYALPLTLIPVFLSIYRYVSTEWHSPYAILALILQVLLELCYWLLIAFFFGYFYRHLRGNSGLGKGVILAIVIVLPYLCLRLLMLQNIEQMTFFFIWASEIFAYCTILGLLAFDYETLRLCGFSWQQLTAIHRTPTLSAFASTLLAAQGPLIIAISQGKTLEIVNFALSFFGKLFPETAPVTPD
jgi:hypothetical protein